MKDLDVRLKSKTTRKTNKNKKKTGKNLLDIGLGDECDTKSTGNKSKIRKVKSHQTENFHNTKDTTE